MEVFIEFLYSYHRKLYIETVYRTIGSRTSYLNELRR